MKDLTQHIESLIFTTDHSITIEEISDVLEEAFGLKHPEQELQNSIDELKKRYATDEYAIEVVEIAGGYQFLSKGSYHNTVGVFLKQTTRRRLSRSALETLSIIAYKQPVTKTEMEQIRGVSCDYSIRKLLEKELVLIVGRSEGPGKPLLYATSDKFMDYFGLKSITDLPSPKEFSDPENTIGELAPIEETLDELNPTADRSEEE